MAEAIHVLVLVHLPRAAEAQEAGGAAGGDDVSAAGEGVSDGCFEEGG